MRSRKIIIITLATIFVAFFIMRVHRASPSISSQRDGHEEFPDDASATSTVYVPRVVDGDTLVAIVDGHDEKVRMLGIDTPESVDPRKPVQCFAHEASARLAALLTGKRVVFESDSTNSDRDKYGRLLRYVSFPDGTSINAQMIRDGYARAYIKFPFERRAEYLHLQTEARDAGRGLWSPSTCHGRR